MNSPSPSSAWYREVTRWQWLVLAVASAGWVFDIYEAQLFTIFKTPALRELLGNDKKLIDFHGNVAMAVFLVGGAVGGLGFGMLADRVGRVKVMAWTILTYSVFSALTFFARSVMQIEVLRFFVALGTGGEWAVAATLVSETFPVRARAFASGTFHASSVIGAALAALTGYFLVGPRAWRYGFLLGFAPALLILWIRIGLRESPAWRDRKTDRREIDAGHSMNPDNKVPSGSLRLLLADPFSRRRALLGLAMASVGLGTYWGIFTWAPELIGEVLGPSVSAEAKQSAGSFAFLLMNLVGAFLGLLSFAPLAARWGRRAAFAVYQTGALVIVPVTFLFATSYVQALLLLLILSFFVVGLHAGFAIYLPELFPTHLRATGASFCFNGGRLIGAVMLIVRGYLDQALGLRWSAVAMASLFAVGLVLLRFAPETKDQDLLR